MAIYYFRNAGTNWGDAANWSLSDGGGADGAVPTSADDAYFTSNSGNCTVDTSARVCKTLIFSGVGAGNYANTFTVDQQITVSGDVTLSATMTVAGTAALRISTSATLTSNGTTWSGDLVIVGNLTITFGSDWTVIGSFSTTNTTGTVTLNSNTLTVGGSFTLIINTGNVVGTTNIVLNGTGTLSTNNATEGSIRNNLTINTAGTITIGTQLSYTTGTLTYTAGTVITAGSTLRTPGNGSLATDGIVWNDILLPSLSTQTTITLSNNLTCSGNFTANNIATSLTLNGSTFTIGGSFTANNITSGVIQGTTNIVLNGTGTLSTNNATEGRIANNITINTTGTITLGTRLSYALGTFTYTTGTVVTTGNTLRTLGNCTFATNGMTWDTVSFGQFVSSQSQTITLSNPMSCVNVGTNNVTGSVTLTGSTLTVSGNFTANSITTGSFTGTTAIVMNGTGTLSTLNATTGTIQNSLTINTSGTITIGANLTYGIGTLTYTAGTVDTTGSTLRLAAGCTLATNGITWSNISYTIGSAVTITLSNNLTCSGNFAVTSATANTLTLTGSTFTIGGSFTANTITTGSIGGTTNIVLNGTGTLSTNAATTGAVISNLTINTSGTITFGTVFSYGTRTFTYTSGTVATSGNTLSLQTSCTLNLDGINFNAIATNGTATYTLTSDLTAVSLTIPTAVTTTINGQTLYLRTFSGGTTTHGGTTVMYFTGGGSFNSGAWNFVTTTIDGSLSASTWDLVSSTTTTRSITQLRGVFSISTLVVRAGITNLSFLDNTVIGALTVVRPLNTLNLLKDIYVAGTLTFSGSNTNMNNTAVNGAGIKVRVGGSVAITSATDIGGLTGTATIEMVGTGTLLNVVNIVPTGVFNIPVTINTDGFITIPTSNMPQLNNVFTFVKGNIARNNATITFRNNIFGASKSNFDSVAILGGASITMDEFFNGRPDRPCTVVSSSGTNYTINFQNGLEKFARFVNVRNATIARRGQLTVITDGGNNGNNVGVKFGPNQLPNGIAKNNPSVINPLVYGASGLVEDSVFV